MADRRDVEESAAFARELREEYERRVRALGRAAAEYLAAGGDAESVARRVHAERRALTAVFKARTPEPLRSRVRARTPAVYGDEIGPTIDCLRARGATWEETISGASRPGPGLG
ncbi:hypothetical protein AB0910_18960 [Streptomyces sp. NPDC047002]|uniref:hypothetical protein n=1 Tax=Streptomyces sp. NPDC047002 TaxID=3155475 RepID=UPI00345317B8